MITYSFRLKKPTSKWSDFENLFISKNLNQSFNLFILKFKYTKNKEKPFKIKRKKIQIKELQNFDYLKQLFSKEILGTGLDVDDCVQINYWCHQGGSQYHTPDSCGDPDGLHISLDDSECGSPGGGGSNTNNDGYSDNDEYNDNNTSSGGGGNTGSNTNGGSGGVVEPPCGDEIHNCGKKADIIASQLQLNYDESEWLRGQPQGIIEFYENYLYINSSIEAENWAKGNIELEEKTSKITLTYNPGKIRGRVDLNYTHVGSDGARTTYKLTNGDLVVSSNTKLVINNYENGYWTSEVSNDNFWYIKTKETGKWAQLLINENHTSLADDLRRLFILGAKDLSKMLGTYVIPVEDFKIVFTGKDFNGQPTSRWLGAGMLLMEVIPGGKLLKPLVKTSKLVTTPLKIAIKEGGGYVVKSLGKVVNVEITTSVFNDAIQYLSEAGVELARVTNNVLTVSKHKIKAKVNSLVFMGENEINAIMKGKGYPDPPFKGAATEFVSEQAEQFVRFHNASNPNRSWMMKLSDVENFTNLDQVRNAFSLDASNIMDKVSSFTVPAGKKMYAGTANGLYGFDGRGYQFFIDGNVDINWKGVTKTITDFFN